MKEILIFTADSNGAFPVPAVRGGAVSSEIEHLIDSSNINKNVHFTIVSYYDKNAEKKALECYPLTDFVWIKRGFFIKALDQICFIFISKFMKKKKSISYKTPFSLIKYIKKGTKFLKKNKFDYVLLENNIPIAKIIKKSKYDGKFFYHFHNIPRIDFGCKDVFNKCSGYLTVSDFIGNEISSPKSAIGQIDKKKIMTLYNVVDTSIFYKRDKSNSRKVVLDKLGISNKKVILYVGRISEEKGISILIDALSKLNRTDFALLIVGSLTHGDNIIGDYERSIKLKINDCSFITKFTGYIKHEELPLFYSGVDLVVLPSIWNEPAGLTMVETLFCENQLITTKDGGIPEYVGEAAIMVEKNNQIVDELSEKIDKALDGYYTLNHNKIDELRKKCSVQEYSLNFEKCIDLLLSEGEMK